jgi:hypothetical protein
MLDPLLVVSPTARPAYECLESASFALATDALSRRRHLRRDLHEVEGRLVGGAEQAVLGRPASGLPPAVHVEAPVDVREVELDRLVADPEAPRHRVVGRAGGDEAQDLELAPRQAARAAAAPARTTPPSGSPFRDVRQSNPVRRAQRTHHYLHTRIAAVLGARIGNAPDLGCAEPETRTAPERVSP